MIISLEEINKKNTNMRNFIVKKVGLCYKYNRIIIFITSGGNKWKKNSQ